MTKDILERSHWDDTHSQTENLIATLHPQSFPHSCFKDPLFICILALLSATIHSYFPSSFRMSPPVHPNFPWARISLLCACCSHDLLHQPSASLRALRHEERVELVGWEILFMGKEAREHHLRTRDTRFVVIWLIRLIIFRDTLIFKAITFLMRL